MVSAKEITTNYLKGWFTIDFVCAVPFDRIVPLCVAVDSTTLRAIKIVRILRVGRLVKLVRVFQTAAS